MRKFIVFLLSMFFLGCSSDLENTAKKQMEKTMHELAKDPESVKISDIKTVFSDDSLCILDFKVTAKNRLGGVESSMFEYVYRTRHVNGEKEIHESWLDLKEKGSLMELARNYYETKMMDFGNIKEMSPEEKKSWYVHFAADMFLVFKSRKVGGNEDGLDSWEEIDTEKGE